MLRTIHIPPATLGKECEALREEVRDFLADAMRDVPVQQKARNWAAVDPAFSRRLGERGWIGMTWPRRYGGAERSSLERYVVLEELLAAGAPLAAHWIADRQSGPLLMRFAPALAERLLPSVARGRTYFCIGMSEPDTGSDLASVRSRAVRSSDGWVIEGRKLWTSFARDAHFMIALVRTGAATDDRRAGLSQFLVDMKSPGVQVRPIRNAAGDEDFNEVILDRVQVPEDALIGDEGAGWVQVTSELAYERSGPERYLSNTQLMRELIALAEPHDPVHTREIGRLVAEHAALRQMSLGVAGMLAREEDAAIAAALVKDQGALLEQRLPEVAHRLFGDRALPAGHPFDVVRDYATRASVSYSLRGGTREILRGIVARALGLR